MEIGLGQGKIGWDRVVWGLEVITILAYLGRIWASAGQTKTGVEVLGYIPMDDEE